MNLVSYEFVACQGEKKGVLILSEVITSDHCLFALFLSYTCVLILFPAKPSQRFSSYASVIRYNNRLDICVEKAIRGLPSVPYGRWRETCSSEYPFISFNSSRRGLSNLKLFYSTANFVRFDSILLLLLFLVCWSCTISWSWCPPSKPLEYNRSCCLYLLCFGNVF